MNMHTRCQNANLKRKLESIVTTANTTTTDLYPVDKYKPMEHKFKDTKSSSSSSVPVVDLDSESPPGPRWDASLDHNSLEFQHDELESVHYETDDEKLMEDTQM